MIMKKTMPNIHEAIAILYEYFEPQKPDIFVVFENLENNPRCFFRIDVVDTLQNYSEHEVIDIKANREANHGYIVLTKKDFFEFFIESFGRVGEQQ